MSRKGGSYKFEKRQKELAKQKKKQKKLERKQQKRAGSDDVQADGFVQDEGGLEAEPDTEV